MAFIDFADLPHYRITNAVQTSGALKQRLFNAAYNSKKQAVMNGELFQFFCDTSPVALDDCDVHSSRKR